MSIADSLKAQAITRGASLTGNQASSAQSSGVPVTGVPAMLGNGRLIDASAIPLTLAAIAGRQQNLAMWFPFVNNGTKPRLFERGSGLRLINNGATKLQQQATATFAVATPGVITDTAHGLAAGTPIFFNMSQGGTAPTGVTMGKRYYAFPVNKDTYNIGTSANNNATDLVAVGTTGTGTFTRYSAALDGSRPAVVFGGAAADFLYTNPTEQGALQQAILRLDTLAEDGSDAIVIYWEEEHGLGVPSADATIFFWGRKLTAANGNGPGCGWGLSHPTAAAKVKLQFSHCAKGAPSNVDKQDLDFSGQFVGQGDGNLAGFFGGSNGAGVNTRSCFCVSISKFPVGTGDQGNNSKGTGQFYFEMAKVGLTDQGYFGQKNYMVSTPYRFPSGSTGIADTCTDVALTIGAMPTNAQTTAIEPMQAGMGIDNLLFVRRKRQGGIVSQAVHQGAANFLANPNAKQQPACLLN